MTSKQPRKMSIFLGLSFLLFSQSPSLAGCHTTQGSGDVPCCCQVGPDSVMQYWISQSDPVKTCAKCDMQGACFLNESCSDMAKKKR